MTSTPLCVLVERWKIKLASGEAPPIAVLSAGAVLHRVHRMSEGAEYYGARDATWRYDSPNFNYGVMYLGREQNGPFAETLLRDLTDRDILWSRVEKRAAATFVTNRELQLAMVHGDGLGWFGVTADEVRAPHDPSKGLFGYRITQAISERVHDGCDQIDGIEYRSRYNDELCVALFERAKDAIRLDAQDIPFDKTWVKNTVERCGFKLVDLTY